MIKRHHLLVLIVFCLLLAIFWFSYKATERAPKTSVDSSIPSKETSPRAHKINGRRVLNLPPGQEDEAIKKIRPSNVVSEKWQQNVEKALQAQGGNSLSHVSINKLESLIWIYHGLALNVESVAITLANEKKERTSFRALVDSQSGKILQTWDHPVIDPINPREAFGIKVDPRYQ